MQVVNITKIKCPNCGADVQLREGQTRYICEYCDSQLVISEEERKQSPDSFRGPTKFCGYCGAVIPKQAVVCRTCGRQVIKPKYKAPQTTLSRPVVNTPPVVPVARPSNQKDKWVTLVLLLMFGFFGGHKFYEGKAGMGVLYFLTVGLCGIGPIIDFFVILSKPRYYIP